MHNWLYTSHLPNSSDFLFVGDIVFNVNSNKGISFIEANGICDNETKKYIVKVGIKNHILTKMVINKNVK